MKLKLMSLKDMQSKDVSELQAYCQELQATKAELTHLLHTGKEKSTHQLGLIKKSIARAKTLAKIKEEEK